MLVYSYYTTKARLVKEGKEEKTGSGILPGYGRIELGPTYRGVLLHLPGYQKAFDRHLPGISYLLRGRNPAAGRRYLATGGSGHRQRRSAVGPDRSLSCPQRDHGHAERRRLALRAVCVSERSGECIDRASGTGIR
jgi:hypothetical protein